MGDLAMVASVAAPEDRHYEDLLRGILSHSSAEDRFSFETVDEVWGTFTLSLNAICAVTWH